MPPDDGKLEGQQTLPNVGDDTAVKAAEKRAAEAEKRAAKLEEDERKRTAAAEKAKRDSEVKSVDDAKRALEAAEKRAAELEERAKAAEDRIRKRIESRFEQLPAETRERIASFRDAMPIDGWERLVEMELERSVALGGGASDAGDGDGGQNVVPPVSAAGVGRRAHKREGRELHPKSVEILEALGQDTDLARKVITVQRETEGGVTRGRFVYPEGLLKKHLRERALAPVLMTEENRRKIFGV